MLNPDNNLRLSLICTTLLYGLTGMTIIFQSLLASDYGLLFICVPCFLPLIGFVDIVIAGIKKRKISIVLQRVCLTLSLFLIYAGYAVYMISERLTSVNMDIGRLFGMLLTITILLLGPLILFVISLWFDLTLKNDTKSGLIPE